MKHLSDVGIRVLKQNASAVAARAAQGEAVSLTDRGRPVRRLIPIASSTLHSLLAAGLGRAARRNIAALSAPDTGAVLTTELAAMRDAERSFNGIAVVRPT